MSSLGSPNSACNSSINFIVCSLGFGKSRYTSNNHFRDSPPQRLLLGITIKIAIMEASVEEERVLEVQVLWVIFYWVFWTEFLKLLSRTVIFFFSNFKLITMHLQVVSWNYGWKAKECDFSVVQVENFRGQKSCFPFAQTMNQPVYPCK